MNQLVRRRIDFEGFELWYKSLNRAEQQVLTITLFVYAHQAGVIKATWSAALQAASLSAKDDLANKASSFHSYEFHIYDWNHFGKWSKELSEVDYYKLFIIGVALLESLKAAFLQVRRRKSAIIGGIGIFWIPKLFRPSCQTRIFS